MQRRKKTLSVCRPNGRFITADVYHNRDTFKVKVEYLKEVEDDSPVFAENGEIILSGPAGKYGTAINGIIGYLEGLFLRGMNDESNDSGNELAAFARRDKKESVKRSIGKGKGKGNIASVRNSSRRSEPTERPEPEPELENELAETDNRED